MKQCMKCGFLYYIAGILLVLAYILLWILDNLADFQVLRYVGWAILVVCMLLIFLPRFIFRSKGKLEKGKDWTKTSVLVDSGIYSVVRHPLYLGWLLMYVALIFFSQHWLTAITGILGMVCVYLISRQEDQRLIEKFGDDYEHYMQYVPGINFLAGVIRLVRRKARR